MLSTHILFPGFSKTIYVTNYQILIFNLGISDIFATGCCFFCDVKVEL